MLLIYGTNDGAIPADSAERMSEAACEPKEVWIVEGGEHTDTLTRRREEFERRVVGFFDAALMGE